MEKVLLYITGASALWAVSTLAKVQFHFVYDPMSWSDAQSYCRKTYTDLVTVDSAEVVTTLRNTVDSNKMAAITDAWIGLYDDVDSWRWSLSDEAFYQNSEALYRNWPSGQPDNTGGGESCLEMLGNGDWNDIGCDVLRKPICSTVSGLTATFTVINTLMNWTQAQSYCRTHYTDLASVRHSADNENLKAAKPAEEAVWLGLFRDQWKWSNGSLLTYPHWASGEPNGPVENCAGMDFTNSGYWADWECHLAKPFICYYEVPFTNHVMKVKLVGSSSVDLKDGAVQGGLLGQLQQKLKDQGVTAEISLRCMKQPDGNIFYQEKQDGQN
ncbi:PREDICTED: macrophage mannose receptor 1-like [Poecilia mexicana]|uniref:C-type lectin domain-containing protein n=1 Tax=Poecilia mexicana TaxID=48701 RepID=A0A3B3X794_9TELE|nr:PREDICTED: macrophage mannose receptor 1-like [Poecilia mexicana]